MKTEYMTRAVTIKGESIMKLAARVSTARACAAQDSAEFMTAVAGGAIAASILIKGLSGAQEEDGADKTIHFTGAEFATKAMATLLELASDCREAADRKGQTGEPVSSTTRIAAAGSVVLNALELYAALADELFSKDFNEEENPDAATDTDGSAAGV